MINWERWRAIGGHSKKREVKEIQTDHVMVEQFLLPFRANDDQRTEMFERLAILLNDVTMTKDRILVESGSGFVTVRRVRESA